MKVAKLTRSGTGTGKVLVNLSCVVTAWKDDDGSTCITMSNNRQIFVTEGLKKIEDLIAEEPKAE